MFTLTRQWDTDADNKPFRYVLKNGKRFGRIYQVRVRFTGARHNRARMGFRFEFNSTSPPREPIIRKTLGEIYDELLLL